MTKRLPMVVAALLCGTVAGLSAEEAGSSADIYAAQCAFCHGATGAGDGAAASMIKPPPTAFDSAEYWKSADRARLVEIVAKGKAGTGMVPFGGKLSSEQIEAVVRYLETFSK